MINKAKENFNTVSKGLTRKAKKEFTKSLLKCLAFYAVFYYLFLATDLKDMNAGIFWLIIILIAVVPVIMFKLYRIFSRSFVGTVTEIKNDSSYIENPKTPSVKPKTVFMITVDTCNVLVQSDDGEVKKFTCKQAHLTNFARSYYLVGDKLTLPKYAQYPYNNSRSPSHPFCLGCGYIGKGEEKECPDCRVPFVLPDEE